MPAEQALATAATVNDVIATLKPGHTYVYHVGSLMHDRARRKNAVSSFALIEGAAKAAWDAYERGEVTLVQRRLAHLQHEYILIKRHPEKPKANRRAARMAGGVVTAPVTEVAHA